MATKKSKTFDRNNAKILLVQPASTTQPPLGLLYISAVLKKAGYKNIKFVAINDDYNKYERSTKYYKDLLKEGQDIVAITTTTPILKEAIDYANLAKKYKTLTVFGGPGATDIKEELIKKVKNLDYVFCGEAENRIAEFFDKILKKEDISNIKGIAYRKNKKYAYTGEPELIKDLNTLPFPDRSILDFDSYSSPITILTSRGCPYNCCYCWKSIHGNWWRERSVKNVVDEIEYLINTYEKEFNKSNRTIGFSDDNFNVDINRAKNIAKEIIRRGIKANLVFASGLHVKTVDLELFQLLKRAGCTEIWFGMESGNEEILASLGKGINMDMVRKAVKLAKKAGIQNIGGKFILGLPEETKKTAMDTINFAKELKLNLVWFNHLVILPHTRLWNWGLKNAKFLYKFDKYNFKTYVCNYEEPVFETKEFSKEERIECYNIAVKYANSLIKKKAFTLKTGINFLKKIKSINDLKIALKKLYTFLFAENLTQKLFYVKLKSKEEMSKLKKGKKHTK